MTLYMKRSDKNETWEMSITLHAMKKAPETLIQGVEHVSDDLKHSLMKIVVQPFSVVGPKSVLGLTL